MSEKEQEKKQHVDTPVEEEKIDEVKEKVVIESEEVSETKEETTEEAPVVEEVAEEVKEEKDEEVKEEEAKEAPVVEEVAEEVKEEKDEEVKEEVAEEIKTTKEELAVIKEVRNELVNLYAKNKDLKITIETLTKENEQLTSAHLQTKEQLDKYLRAEKLLKIKQHNSRIEKLSKKFDILGQKKSVEYLSKKSENTLSEFEQIVDAALKISSESTEQLSVIEPSQGQELSDDKPSNKKTVEEKPIDVKASNDKFFSGLLNQMTHEQVKSGNRTLNL